ncbi:glucosamine-6-phosphate deaminase [Anaerobacillus alkaliphilus]|uniref:Glucosamine-6-phosphate deaminase n=1 Tax=Anaerobacillus alkaliphilus TaxID=1548597 RepID=A0A4Q0VX21_9BACI|nr:glucosamine-6-phosphate deaminase [Anaerobacillus alkaliphilus]RXJ02175.1 glucosamine-6-phosphate deaminase [Anaerobacillus alkaliphilus]
MKVNVVKDIEELSLVAAKRMIEKVRRQPTTVLGLATGSTPLGTYRKLVQDFQENRTSYKHVTTFNLDEYVGLAATDKNSYHYYMNDHLFGQININQAQTFLPNGAGVDPSEECLRYEEKIRQSGGIDLQILGLGENGHIGFNEPGTSFSSQTHVVTLAETTRVANSRYFPSLADVPTEAITMGIETIMKAREILLLVSGEKKAKALREVIEGSVSETVPATVLRNHPNITIIADEASVKCLTKEYQTL